MFHIMSKLYDWSLVEDVYLNQGVANFSTDFKKIKDVFPFKQSHQPSDLQERWREIEEVLTPSAQEVREKILISTGRFKKPLYGYSAEYEDPSPNLPDFEEYYSQMPSLAASAMQYDTNSQEEELTNINELSLNAFFTAESIYTIVNDAFNKVIDDEHLRSDLVKDFHSRLIQKGRKIALAALSSTLEQINAFQPNSTEQDNECIIFEDKITKILLVIQYKMRLNVNLPTTKGEYIEAFRMISYIQQFLIWPKTISQRMETLKRNIYTKLAQLCTYFFNVHLIDKDKIAANKALIEIACKIDLYNEMETHVNNLLLKQEILSIKNAIAQAAIKQQQELEKQQQQIDL